MFNSNKNKILKRALVIMPGLLALGIAVYLIVLPFYPSLKYKIASRENSDIDYKNIDSIKEITEKMIGLPASNNIKEANNVQPGNAQDEAGKSDVEMLRATPQPPLSGGRDEPKQISNALIIPKIGVNIPIIESEDENYGLERGAWKLPKSSTPDGDGNMILTGHRFKYLPPSNLTFFLFHKLEAGDVASIIWNGEPYYYKIKEIKKVSADDTSILKQTKTSTLTMYTCDPIYSTKNRLVVVAELVE